MEKVFVILNTADTTIADLCEDYWAQENNRWKYKVKELSDNYDIDQYAILPTVRKNCFAYFENTPNCHWCQLPYQPISNRSGETEEDYRGVIISEKYCCCKCISVALQEKEQEDEMLRWAKEERMIEAFENINLDYQRDDTLIFIYNLSNLTDFASIISIAKRAVMGTAFTQYDGEKLIEELNKKDLINFNVGIEGVFVLPELKKEINRILTERRQRREIQLQQLMLQARDNEAYESLELKEHNYLVALANTENSETAKGILGISDDLKFSLLKRLEDSYLIRKVNEGEYSMLQDVSDKIKEIGYRSYANPLLNKPEEKKLYRKLREKHPGISLQVNLSAIVPMELIGHIIDRYNEKESGWKGYYLSCRVKFIVWEKEFVPKFAIETRGAQYLSLDQVRKEQFKRDILVEAGVPIYFLSPENVEFVSENGIEVLERGNLPLQVRISVDSLESPF